MHHPTKTDSMTELFGEVVSTYSRARALDDGVLIDAGPMAREAGFRWPVSITAAAWSDCVSWSDADNSSTPLPPSATRRSPSTASSAKLAKLSRVTPISRMMSGSAISSAKSRPMSSSFRRSTMACATRVSVVRRCWMESMSHCAEFNFFLMYYRVSSLVSGLNKSFR